MYIDGSAACMHHAARAIICIYLHTARDNNKKIRQRGAGRERVGRQAGAWRTRAAEPSAWRVCACSRAGMRLSMDGFAGASCPACEWMRRRGSRAYAIVL